MRALFYSLLGYFLTPVGVVLMAALDSSMVFFLPLGIDFVVIIMAARKPELFWLYAILATVGSLMGAARDVLDRAQGRRARAVTPGQTVAAQGDRTARQRTGGGERRRRWRSSLRRFRSPPSSSRAGRSMPTPGTFSSRSLACAWCGSWSKGRSPRTTAAGSSRG